MADGPQSPLWLSLKLSHSRTRPWISRWNASEVLPRWRVARTIWTPAEAHQVTLSSWAKTALWLATISKVIGTRGTVGVGVALVVGTGTGVTSGPTAATGVAMGSSSGSRSATSSGAVLATTVSGADRSGTGPAR